MKNYILRTNYDCLIKHENGEEILDINSSLNFTQAEKIIVYPLNSLKDTLPFVIELGTKKQNSNIKTFNYKDNEIVFINIQQQISKTFYENIEFEKKECQIKLSQSILSFKYNNTEKSIILSKSFENYSIIKDKKLIIAHLIGDEEEMWFFAPETNKLFNLNGKKIQKIENQIILTKLTNDIANSQTFKNYEIVEDRIEEKSSKISYSLSQPQTTKIPSIIPIAFLESIKNNDLELARGYLSNELNESASDDHLLKYFGKFQNIIPLEKMEFALIQNNKICIYKFEVENEKITEIDILEN